MLNVETIKGYFDKGLWTAGMVKNAVGKGKLTAAEYESVTGAAYSGAED